MYIYIFLNILERPFESGSTQQTFGSGLLMMLNNCEIGSLFCYLLFWLFVSTNHPGILTVGSWNSRLRDWWIPGFQTQPGGMENNSPFSVQFFELVVFFFIYFDVIWCHGCFFVDCVFGIFLLFLYCLAWLLHVWWTCVPIPSKTYILNVYVNVIRIYYLYTIYVPPNDFIPKGPVVWELLYVLIWNRHCLQTCAWSCVCVCVFKYINYSSIWYL